MTRYGTAVALTHEPASQPSCELGYTQAERREVPLFLTRAETAKLLRVSERTIRRWESEGRLKSAKLTPGRAGRVVIRGEELLRFVRDAE